MAAAEIPEELIAIRNKWPVARCDHKTWKEVQRLVMTGDADNIKKAEELAKKCILDHPHMHARHDGAVTARAKRKEFLTMQRDQEREIVRAMATGSEKMGAVISRLSDDKGQVSPGRLTAIMDKLRELNREIFALYMANRTIQRR